MNKVLLIILFILLLLVGKKRGIKTFITFVSSMLLIILYIILMSVGLNAIILAFIICILASITSIFFLNGNSLKTKSAFISILIVLFIIFILIYITSKKAVIGDFGIESLESIGAFNFDINYNMNDVIIGMYLVSIIGTIIDTSMSVSSAMNEVLENNKTISKEELYKSGMNIGGDILSTTINTLYFALISTFIGFFMWHRGSSIEFVLNYKLFAKEVIQLLIAFIGSILIIPITSYISSIILKNGKKRGDKMKKETSVGCIIIKNNKVLLINEKNGNFWGFPKGHIENNETLKQTALREVKEEVGLDVLIDDTHKYTTNYLTKDNIDKTNILFLAKPLNSKITIQASEINEAKWFSFDTAYKKLSYDNLKEILNKAIKDNEK